MTGLSALRSPLSFLQSRLQYIPHRDVVDAEEGWWKNECVAISDAIYRAGTRWLRMFDRLRKRVDEIVYPREYQTILRRGCRCGVVWRVLEEKSLIPSYLLIYTGTFVVARLLGLLLSIIGLHGWPVYALLAGGLAPVVYSLVIRKQLERRGEL